MSWRTKIVFPRIKISALSIIFNVFSVHISYLQGYFINTDFRTVYYDDAYTDTDRSFQRYHKLHVGMCERRVDHLERVTSHPNNEIFCIFWLIL